MLYFNSKLSLANCRGLFRKTNMYGQNAFIDTIIGKLIDSEVYKINIDKS